MNRFDPKSNRFVALFSDGDTIIDAGSGNS